MMTPPVLVVAPVTFPVTVSDVKDTCSILHDDQDAFFQRLIEEVVAEFDGWHGPLGRAIMPQTWRVMVDVAGQHVLPMPDVCSVEVRLGNVLVDGVELRDDALGPVVTIPGGAGPFMIDFVCGLPAHRVPAARGLIAAVVAHRFRMREAVTTDSAQPVPMGALALAAQLKSHIGLGRQVV